MPTRGVMDMDSRHMIVAWVMVIAGCGAAPGDESTTGADSGGTTEVATSGGSSDGAGSQGSTGEGGSTGGTTHAEGSSGAIGESSGGEASGGSSSGGSSSDSGVAPSPECTQYCTEFLAHCQEIPDVEVYADEADCQAACAGFAHGEPGLFTGDTVECRVDHLTFDPNPGPGYYELHCFHAQEHPTSQCV